MGNGLLLCQNKPGCSASLMQTCLGTNNYILDKGELAIHRQVGIPRGRLYADSLKSLSRNQVQLLYTAGSSNLTSLRYYLNQGIDPNTYDQNRSSPLHVAAREGSVQILKQLLNRGAGIDLADVAGWTPLHVASYYGRSTCVSLLLEHGADHCLVNRRGETAAKLAGNQQTRQIFVRHCRPSEISNKPNSALDLSGLEFSSMLQHRKFQQDQSPQFEESVSMLQTGHWVHPANTQRQFQVLMKDPGQRLQAELILLFNADPFRGLSLMILLGMVSSESYDIAWFLLIQKRLCKKSIGLVIGENQEWYKAIAQDFMRLINFGDLDIVQALKGALSYCEIPSDGSQLNQILHAFACSFVQQNPAFGSVEAIQGLAFSVLLLNDYMQRGNNISKEWFIQNNRGIKEGADLSDPFLEWIYRKSTKDLIIQAHNKQFEPPFQEMERRGVIQIKGKKKYVGLLEGVLFFFPQFNNSPYAIIVVKDASISEHWLTGTISLKKKDGIPAAKLTKDGRVQLKFEQTIQFKSDDMNLWKQNLNVIHN